MNGRKILIYNNMWGVEEEPYINPVIDDFFITNEHRWLDEAVAVIFHMPTLSPDDKMLKKGAKRNGQLWVFWSMECEAHYPWLYEREISDLFDIRATYKMDSDIPLPYVRTDYFERLRQEPAPKHGLISAFISSGFNESKRLEYLEELMRYIPVDSYGKMLNNKRLEKDEGQDTKGNVISGYKFTVAFENAIAMDYVTEKFYQPLIAGSVPVYLGAPNIEEFAPGKQCYINVNSFSSVRSLADYLLELDADEGRYQEYLQWKKQPFGDGFISKMKAYDKDVLLKFCDIIHSKLA